MSLIITPEKKFALAVVLTQYCIKNGIEDFLSKDHTDFKEQLIARLNKRGRYKGSDYRNHVENKISNFLIELQEELDDINDWLDDDENVIFQVLGYNREFFDKTLPDHKIEIKWFTKMEDINNKPFDLNKFLPNGFTL